MKNCTSRVSLASAALLVLALLAPSCGDQDNSVNPEDRLCGGEAGFAARVEGRASPLEVCTSNDDAIVAFSSGGDYVITATMTMNGDFFQFDLLVPHHANFPVVLTLTGDRGAALDDEFAVWMYYQEVPRSGEDVESYEITGGTFRLTYSDTNVMAATFSGVEMKMRTQESTPQDRGTRLIESGFMSLSVDS
jgi:hypothetical protein